MLLHNLNIGRRVYVIITKSVVERTITDFCSASAYIISYIYAFGVLNSAGGIMSDMIVIHSNF